MAPPAPASQVGARRLCPPGTPQDFRFRRARRRRFGAVAFLTFVGFFGDLVAFYNVLGLLLPVGCAGGSVATLHGYIYYQYIMIFLPNRSPAQPLAVVLFAKSRPN